MLVMVGASRSVHCFSKRVGMRSSAHVLDGDDIINSETVQLKLCQTTRVHKYFEQGKVVLKMLKGADRYSTEDHI